MAVTKPNARIYKLTASSDTLSGPLVIRGFKWISQDGSVIVATDQLVTSVGIEHYAEAGNLSAQGTFDPPIRLSKGETLSITTMTHGALLLYIE